MDMVLTTNKRRQALLYLSVAVIGITLLGLCLPNLRFEPGLPIPGAEPDPAAATPSIQTGFSRGSFPWLLQFGLVVGIILLSFALVTTLLRHGNMKRTVLFAVVLILLFVVFSQLPRLAPDQYAAVPINPDFQPPQSEEYAIAPIGEPPASLLFWVAAGLLLAGTVLIGWLLARALGRKQKEDPLAMEARAAVEAIAGGESLRDVIIRSYLKMESVVAQARGIERGQAVTPREFETFLVEKGIPRVPILQLTHLFEKARYGNQNLNQQDQQDAVRCLLAIQKACQPDTEGIG